MFPSSSRILPILNQKIYDDIYVVTDEEAIQTAKDLARLEGLMCGISSGTNVAAALKLAKKTGKRKNCCDRTAGYSRALFFHTVI